MPRSGSLAPATIVIFGASGDLTRRKLVPALHTLGCESFLPATTRVLGEEGHTWHLGCREHGRS